MTNLLMKMGIRGKNPLAAQENRVRRIYLMGKLLAYNRAETKYSKLYASAMNSKNSQLSQGKLEELHEKRERAIEKLEAALGEGTINARMAYKQMDKGSRMKAAAVFFGVMACAIGDQAATAMGVAAFAISRALKIPNYISRKAIAILDRYEDMRSLVEPKMPWEVDMTVPLAEYGMLKRENSRLIWDYEQKLETCLRQGRAKLTGTIARACADLAFVATQLPAAIAVSEYSQTAADIIRWSAGIGALAVGIIAGFAGIGYVLKQVK